MPSGHVSVAGGLSRPVLVRTGSPGQRVCRVPTEGDRPASRDDEDTALGILPSDVQRAILTGGGPPSDVQRAILTGVGRATTRADQEVGRRDFGSLLTTVS